MFCVIMQPTHKCRMTFPPIYIMEGKKRGTKPPLLECNDFFYHLVGEDEVLKLFYVNYYSVECVLFFFRNVVK